MTGTSLPSLTALMWPGWSRQGATSRCSSERRVCVLLGGLSSGARRTGSLCLVRQVQGQGTPGLGWVQEPTGPHTPLWRKSSRNAAPPLPPQTAAWKQMHRNPNQPTSRVATPSGSCRGIRHLRGSAGSRLIDCTSPRGAWAGRLAKANAVGGMTDRHLENFRVAVLKHLH